MNRNYYILMFIAICCLVNGCQPTLNNRPVEKEGKWYGVTKGLFRHRWWNYYERGISFLDGGFWRKAETDFREAIKQRAKDQRRARTYGWHLADYFPHRELGISFFYQQRYSEAVQELETSLSSEKSAKAEFYLDKARKSLIEQNHSDTSPPEISISTPLAESLSNQFSIIVTGMAKDDTFVKKIQINNKPIRIDLASPQISFQTKVPIQRGENLIVAEVTDLAGKRSVTIRKILCDRIGPVLNIDEFKKVHGSDNHYIIRGYAHDDSGIKAILINGQNLITEAKDEIVLNQIVNLQSEQKEIIVVAEDQAGNQTRAKLSFSKPLPARNRLSTLLYGSENILLASLDSFALLSENNYTLPQTSGTRGNMTPEKQKQTYKKLGNYYALLIGINKYSEWNPLNTAVNDVTTLRDILISRYDFSAKNIILRTDQNATQDTIIQDLQYMAGGLTETDNLLIYFAGHGHLDKTTQDGYWIPADGKRDDPSTWITNSAIRHILCSEKVRGKNILVIADACYSGTLLHGERFASSRELKKIRSSRGRGKADTALSMDYQKRLFELGLRRSRQVISSGGIEQVDDKGKERHSLFAYYFLRALQENDYKFIDIKMLFYSRVWQQIVLKGGQQPDMLSYDTPMHQGGQFVLVLKDDTQAVKDESAGKTNTRELFPIINLPDTTPPVISLRGWREKQTVFTDQAFLEIHAHDESGIRSVTVNGEKILKRPGRKLYLNYLTPLIEGENFFLIQCMDQLGNHSEKKIHIRRKLQKIYQHSSRMSVVLFPFVVRGEQMTEIENIFMGHLIKRKRFNMQKPDILGKMLLNPYHFDEQNKALAYALKMGGDFILRGTIVAKEKSLQISVCMIEALNSQLLIEEDVYGESEDIDMPFILKLCQGLVIKICDDLPLAEGRIVKIKGDDIIINMGEEHHLRKGMHLIFFQEGEPVRDIETGEILGTDIDELGTGRIEELLTKMSYTELIDKKSLPLLKVGQRVVTK